MRSRCRRIVDEDVDPAEVIKCPLCCGPRSIDGCKFRIDGKAFLPEFLHRRADFGETLGIPGHGGNVGPCLRQNPADLKSDSLRGPGNQCPPPLDRESVHVGLHVRLPFCRAIPTILVHGPTCRLNRWPKPVAHGPPHWCRRLVVPPCPVGSQAIVRGDPVMRERRIV